MDNGKDNKEFKGIWIPKEYLECKSLTHPERLVLSIITALDNGKGCYATNRYFGKILDLTKNHISTLINSLNEKDFISCYVDQSEGNKRIINISTHIDKLLDPISNLKDTYTEKPLHPIRENPIHNNKDYNKVNKKRERARSHFDFLNTQFPKEINILKGKYNLPLNEWKFCINKFDQKNLRPENINLITFETYLSNWNNNLKDNIKQEPKQSYQRIIN